MLHHAAAVRGGKQLFIDLIHALEHLAACGGLVLLPHGRPNVGEDHVRAGRRLHGVSVKLEALIGFCKIQNLFIGVIPFGARYGDAHTRFQTADDQGVRHVVAVADVAHFKPVEMPFMLANGQKVCEHLAGVAEIRQPVDDRDAAVFGERLHLALRECTDHDTVEIAREHTRGVFDRLAAPDLQITARQKQRLPAELVHARFKRNARARG